MICTNPECEMYGKETLRGIMAREGSEYSYCIHCHVIIDEEMQPVTNNPGPYFKRGAWLKEWKLINRDSNPNNAKLNPRLD